MQSSRRTVLHLIRIEAQLPQTIRSLGLLLDPFCPGRHLDSLGIVDDCTSSAKILEQGGAAQFDPYTVTGLGAGLGEMAGQDLAID